MSIEKKILIPLVWYDKIEKQDRFKDYCAHCADPVPIITDLYHLPRFIFKAPTTLDSVTGWEAIRVSDGVVENLAGYIGSVSIEQFGLEDYFVFKSDSAIASFASSCEVWYYKMTVGTKEFFSDTFRFEDFDVDASPYLTLKWKHDKNLGAMYYDSGFENILYLENCAIYRPEATQTREAELKPDGSLRILSETLEFKSSIETLALGQGAAEALEFMSIHDDVRVYEPSDPEKAICMEEIKVTTTPVFSGCNSIVKIEFKRTVNTLDSGCASDLIAAGCIVPVDSAEDRANPDDEAAIRLLPPSDGHIYLVYDNGSSVAPFNAHIGQVAKWNASASDWDYIIPAIDDGYLDSSIGVLNFFDGVDWRELPSIALLRHDNANPPDACAFEVTAYAPTGLFVEYYYRIGAGSFIIFDTIYEGGTATLTWTSVSTEHDFMVRVVNRGCDYGSSLELSMDSGPAACV